MNISKNISVLLAVVVIVLALSLLMPFSTTAADPVTLSVSSPSEVAPQSDFFVYVDVGPVTRLGSWQFDLSYDKNVIQPFSEEGGAAVSGGLIGTTNIPVESWRFQPPGTPGMMRVQGRMAANTTATGSGYLAEIRFKVSGAIGLKSNMNLTNANLYDNTLTLMTSKVTVSLVTVVASPKVAPTRRPQPSSQPAATPPSSPTPSSTASPKPSSTTTPSSTPASSAKSTSTPTTPAKSTSTPGPATSAAAKISIAVADEVPVNADFVVRVDILKVEDLDSYQFVFSYNPDIVEVTDVTSGQIGPTAVPVGEWDLVPSKIQGQVKVMGHIPGSKGVSGSGYLVKIHCHMIGLPRETSNLTLSNVGLFDTTASPILFALVADGSVTVGKTVAASGSNLKIIIIIVPTLVVLAVIGILIFYFLRKRRRTIPVKRPSAKVAQVITADEMLDVMRNRLSQLPSRRKDQKPGPTRPPPRK